MTRPLPAWDVTCECGRFYAGTGNAVAAWVRRHARHDRCRRMRSWQVQCVCGWAHADTSRDKCRDALAAHQAVRDYEAPPCSTLTD